MAALIPIIITLAAGIFSGFLLRKRGKIISAASNAAQLAIYGLLFVLGGSLGVNDGLFAQLPKLGAIALTLTLSSSVGSVLCTLCIQRFFPLDSAHKRETAQSGSALSAIWGTLRIICCFGAGVSLARIGMLPLWLCDAKLAEYALWILIYAISIVIGSELHVFSILKKMHVKIFLVPAATIVGTALGCLVAAQFIPLTLRDTMSVGAGFSYYSITSIIIAESGNTLLASVGLLANMFRELLGILATPFLARYCGLLTPVAVAGATSMDTCLPVIARYCGEQTAIIAIFNGMLFTFLAPVCVALIVYW